MMDNTIAISYISKMGGPTLSVLSSLALDLWQWCPERSITVEAHRCPGRYNIVADFESRARPDTSDWQLDPSIFQGINNYWGLFTTFCKQTDITTAQVCELEARSRGRAVDAFTLDWSQLRGYAFPPFSIILAYGWRAGNLN